MATIGDLVLYKVSESDSKRFQAQQPLRRPGIDGVYPSPGDVLPGTVVKVDGGKANLNVSFDGGVGFWVQGAAQTSPGTPGGFWPR